MRAEMLHVPGVMEAQYHPHHDYFTVRFDSDLVSLESILATVVQAGKRLGRDYRPEVIR